MPVTLDAAGNTTDNGTFQFSYNAAGRLSQVHQGTTLVATYTYNALGQRTRKVTGTTTTIYHYDLFGMLIAETSSAGVKQRAYVWHNGSPVAQIDANGTAEALIQLHTDHLATARVATNAAGAIVWTWAGEAFGATAPQEDVDNDGVSTIVNLRFPGQYYDVETGLYYNYFRFYDPRSGRYITSDPIGITSSFNTFAYANSNSIALQDIKGLYISVLTKVVQSVCGALTGANEEVNKQAEKDNTGIYERHMEVWNKAYQEMKDQCVLIQNECEYANCLNNANKWIKERGDEEWNRVKESNLRRYEQGITNAKIEAACSFLKLLKSVDTLPKRKPDDI